MTTIPQLFPDCFILLTGGAGRRLGGADKAAIAIGGSTLLDRAVRIASGRPVIVVGPDPDSDASVIVTREDPPGGGPAAGVAAGVAALARVRLAGDTAADAAFVAVQAIDQAGVTPATWRRLTAAAGSASGDRPGGAILASGGRRQYGAGVFPQPALAAACASRPSWHGRPLHELLDPIIAAEIDALGDEARDIDTLEDLTWWQAHADAPRAQDEPGDERT